MLVFSLDFIILSNSNTSRSTCEGLYLMCAKKKKPRSKDTCRPRLTPRALPKRRSCTYEHKLGNYAKLRLSKSGQLPSEAAPSKQQGANLHLDLTSNTSAQRTRAAQSRRRFDRSFGWSARSSSPSLNSNMQEKKCIGLGSRCFPIEAPNIWSR